MELTEMFGKDVYKFREENMSHNSAEEYFSNRDDVPDNYKKIYKQILLSKVNIESKDEDYLLRTELEMAVEAMDKGCEHVTNIDYSEHDRLAKNLIIAATGWKPK